MVAQSLFYTQTWGTERDCLLKFSQTVRDLVLRLRSSSTQGCGMGKKRSQEKKTVYVRGENSRTVNKIRLKTGPKWCGGTCNLPGTKVEKVDFELGQPHCLLPDCPRSQVPGLA